MGNKKLLVILLVAVTLKTIECAQYARGYESNVNWGYNHYLMNNRNSPRTVEYRVNYGMEMRKIPQIMINPNIYDWEWGNPVDWEIVIKDVDRKGFTYSVTAISTKSIYSIFFNWLAVTGEDSLQIKYYKLNTNNLANGNAESMRINFDFEHEVTPLVWTSWIGVSFIGGDNWKLYQNVANVDRTGFTYELTTNGQSRVQWVKIACLSIDPDRAYTINSGNFVNNQNINFNGDFVYLDYQVTDDFRKKGNPPEPFSAIKGYSVYTGANMRLQCQRDAWWPNTATQRVRMGRWANTRLDELQYTQFIYTASSDKCAKFYSECAFQGEELFVLCEDQDNSIAAEIHGMDVRSIKIAKGLQVKLYEKENF